MTVLRRLKEEDVPVPAVPKESARRRGLRGSRLTVDIDEARRLHEGGWTWERIADHLGVSQTTLFSRMRGEDTGDSRPTEVVRSGAGPVRRIAVDMKEARRLRERGLSWKEVGRRLGVSESTLFERRKEAEEGEE